MKANRLFFEWAALFALAVAGTLLLQLSEITYRLDNQGLDYLSALSRPEPSSDIALVAIDDRSLDEVGSWPWPRSRHADLIDRLDEAGARVVVLDILFLEPTNAQEDDALAAAMARSGNVVLPHTFVERLNASSVTDPDFPLAKFQETAAAFGHVAADTDSDGILRRFDLQGNTQGKAYPHLALRVLDLLGEKELAQSYGETALISFNSEANPQYFSASRVIAGEYPPELFADKIVLVGATAQGMGDRYSVASGSVRLMTGIETQANLINALLTKGVIAPASGFWQALVAIIAIGLLFASFWTLSPRQGLYVAIGLIAALIASSAILLIGFRIWLPISAGVLIIMLAYPVWNWRRLTLVSRYFDREAVRLVGVERIGSQGGGMEYVAGQIENFRGLVRTIEGSLEYLRQVIEAAPDAMIVVDAHSKVKMLNEKAVELFTPWTEGDEPNLGELFLASHMSLQKESSEAITQDGRTFLIARAPLDTGLEESIAGEILALREITALRRLDQERKQMLEFLSHDMRTPQVAIIGLTRKQGSNGAEDDSLRRIRNQANRTLKLADDFVQLARLENPQLQMEDSDLCALIEEACDRAYVLAEAKNITIEQKLPDEPCFADVDASLIARMFDNLIGNAVKYSPEESTITVGLEKNGALRHQIIVSDEGIGLPEARVKDPFARFGAHATDAGPSAGLGLALVKKVVDAHRGTITVASQKDKGTRFTISLGG